MLTAEHLCQLWIVIPEYDVGTKSCGIAIIQPCSQAFPPPVFAVCNTTSDQIKDWGGNDLEMRLAIIPPHTPTYVYIALNNEGTSLAIAIHTSWWRDPSSPVVHGWHWSHLWMASHIQLLCYPQWWIHWPRRNYVNRFPVFVYHFNSWLWFIYLMSQLTPTYSAFLHVLHFPVLLLHLLFPWMPCTW